jgi:ATP-dependent Clp protease ATP-binding subunit ClpA
LRCIGSTTDKDWRQYFEKDRALLRRFKKLIIDEPSIADTKLILYGLREAYERYHDVSYTDAALDAAVDLTVRYVHDAQLPDKAIDVIDEAGARQRITDEGRQRLIDVAAIEREVGRIVKIPTHEIQESEAVKLQRLESDLMATVFGQATAIHTLVDAVLINRAGLRAPNKPEGAFLFVGPSGVGKSEMARQLAKTLGLPLVKFDMSEYIERHSVAKFIGAPPGYVGFGDGGAGDGLLINAVDKTPACVLLLDEIEKAHADIMNLLLQVMDDASLTNSAGKTVNFRNVILIMTSNIGVAATEQHGIGFLPEVGTIDEKAVQQAFSPEFRNRLDAVVTFAGLDHSSIQCVVQKFIGELRSMLITRNVDIEVTSDAENWLVRYGHDAVYGARPLERLIHRKIKQPLSRLLLFGALRDGGTARCIVEDNDLVVVG